MITYRYKLNMTPGGIPVRCKLGQYDDDWAIVFSLYSHHGNFSLESGTTARIRGTKKDGLGYSADATINIQNKTVTVAGDKQITAVAGANIFELVLYQGTKELSTANIIFDVERAAMDAGTLVSDSQVQEILDMSADVIAASENLSVLRGNFAPTYSTSGTYAVGDYVIYNNQLYRCIAAITTAESWTSAHWAAEKVGSELSNLKSDVSNTALSYDNIIALQSETPAYEMLSNRILSNAGVVTEVTDAQQTVSSYIPVEPGWVIAYKHSCARWLNQNWAFYNANHAVISTSGKTVTGKVEEFASRVRVPLGAAYFVLAVDVPGSNRSAPSEDIRIIKKYAEAIDSNPESVDLAFPVGSVTAENCETTTATGSVIGSVALVVNGLDESYVTTQAAVSHGDFVQVINSSARYSNKMYAFYDAAGHPIYAVDRVDNEVHDFQMVRVPFGAVKLIVSGYGSTFPEVKRITGISAADTSKWVGKKWACMGDSLTEENGRATKRYHDYIADATGIEVVNLGKSGTGYMKPYNSNLPFFQRVDTIPVDSDVITIFGSGNDCNQTLGNVTDTGTDTICGCINNTIDGIRARIVGANIGIIAPTPWQPYPTATVGNKMDLYVGALQEICKRKGVPFLDLYHCSNMLPWEQSFREAFYTRDDGNGTHPDENGHRFFAPHIKAFLETLLM